MTCPNCQSPTGFILFPAPGRYDRWCRYCHHTETLAADAWIPPEDTE